MWHLEGKLSVTPLKGNCCGTWVKIKSEGALTFTAIIYIKKIYNNLGKAEFNVIAICNEKPV